MLRSWKLGRLFGIDLYLHWSILLLFAAVFVTSLEAGVPTAATTVALAAAVFVCVLMHEYGHALAARALGIGTRDITLYPIGGVARLENMSSRPTDEVLIAVAGPAVNFLIAAVLGFALAGISIIRILLWPDTAGPVLGGSFLFHLLLSNVVLAFFNLIPAFPMDGGRVLRALLTLGLGRLRATQVAANVGLVLALAIAAVPVLLSVVVGVPFAPVLMLVGLFVVVAGRFELQMVRRAEAASADEELPTAEPVEEDIPEALPVRPLLPPLAPRPDVAE